MGLGSKIFGEKKSGITEGYVDLEKYIGTTEHQSSGAVMKVGMGEIQSYDDLRTLSDYVCGGNILILDFSHISQEEVILKRITNELKQIAHDINGDIAGIGNNLMILAPHGVKIDRRKIRGKFA
ncbi:MAG: cell division protein SepF [Candidatus Thermoplasmatota archaeon]|nr:cell division protein SepF [Candidatus Thermoplasmatota archaeon]MBU1941124.1 cell division protein SepF [Candidatus Thermoplasmatota archaeon]